MNAGTTTAHNLRALSERLGAFYLAEEPEPEAPRTDPGWTPPAPPIATATEED